jgi:hypothetical protein
VVRALKAVRLAGFAEGRVEIARDGRMIITAGRPDPVTVDHRDNGWSDDD